MKPKSHKPKHYKYYVSRKSKNKNSEYGIYYCFDDDERKWLTKDEIESKWGIPVIWIGDDFDEATDIKRKANEAK